MHSIWSGACSSCCATASRLASPSADPKKSSRSARWDFSPPSRSCTCAMSRKCARDNGNSHSAAVERRARGEGCGSGRHLGQDRKRNRRAAGRRAEGVISPPSGFRRARSQPVDPRRLQAPRSGDLFHRRTQGGARLDGGPRNPRGRRPPGSSTPISKRVSSAPKPSPMATTWRSTARPARATPASSGSKAGTISSPTATSCISASPSEAAMAAPHSSLRGFRRGRDPRLRQVSRDRGGDRRLRAAVRSPAFPRRCGGRRSLHPRRSVRFRLAHLRHHDAHDGRWLSRPLGVHGLERHRGSQVAETRLCRRHPRLPAHDARGSPLGATPRDGRAEVSLGAVQS